MALYSLLFAGGKGAARNPNLSFGGSGEHSLLSSLDPIGNFITGFGGDPLNLYGNKNNPNALLFPSGSPSGAGGASGTLPFTIGTPGGYKPQLPATGFAPPQVPAGGQGLNFQGMPGFGAPQQQSLNPFLAAMMQYLAPPKAPTPAPMAGGRGMGGGGYGARGNLPYLPPRLGPMQRMQ